MNDRVIVITGASGGIGAEVARRTAARGAKLVLVARRTDALAAVAADCGDGTVTVTGDLTRREDADRTVEEAVARLGHIDVWINNVGRGIWRAPSELTDSDVEEMIRVNVLTALHGMQAVLPHFKERGAGHLINISSMLGRVPHAINRSGYNGAKHFLGALTANFRTEIQATHPGIAVSLVSPGVVYTDFGKHAVHGGPESRRLAGGQEVGEAAEVIVGVIESRRPDVYSVAGSRARVVTYFEGLGQDP